MPLLGQPMIFAFGLDDQAVQLPRQPDGEIANVDHFLHFAKPFGWRLAHLKADKSAECILGGAQFFAQQAHEFATPRCRHQTPGEIGLMRRADKLAGVRDRGLGDRGDDRAVDWRDDIERTAPRVRGRDAEVFENAANFVEDRGLASR